MYTKCWLSGFHDLTECDTTSSQGEDRGGMSTS
jgi:hypothetical protein